MSEDNKMTPPRTIRPRGSLPPEGDGKTADDGRNTREPEVTPQRVVLTLGGPTKDRNYQIEVVSASEKTPRLVTPTTGEDGREAWRATLEGIELPPARSGPAAVVPPLVNPPVGRQEGQRIVVDAGTGQSEMAKPKSADHSTEQAVALAAILAGVQASEAARARAKSTAEPAKLAFAQLLSNIDGEAFAADNVFGGLFQKALDLSDGTRVGLEVNGNIGTAEPRPWYCVEACYGKSSQGDCYIQIEAYGSGPNGAMPVDLEGAFAAAPKDKSLSGCSGDEMLMILLDRCLQPGELRDLLTSTSDVADGQCYRLTLLDEENRSFDDMELIRATSIMRRRNGDGIRLQIWR